MRILRFILPYLVCVIGVAILFIALVSYCGAILPYQDPNPTLLTIQRGQINSAILTALIGGLIFLAGVVWSVRDLMFRKRVPR